MMKSSLLYLSISLALTSAACKHDANEQDAAATVLPPATAPADLLGYARLVTPDATWASLQKSFGPAASLLPSTVAGLMGSAVGVDAEVTSLADGATPAFAAFERTSKGIAWVVSFRARDAVRAAGVLTSGSPAKYGATSQAGLTMYTRTTKPGEYAAQAAIGLTPDRLLIASDAEALAAIGPYAARTLPLPAQTFADGAIVLQADHPSLAGPLHDLLTSGWAGISSALSARAVEEQQRHGRAADFGSPEAVQHLFDGWAQTDLAVVADLERASLAIDVDEGAIVARAKMTPTAAGTTAATTLAQLPSCDLAPLGQASLDAPLSLLLCRQPSGGPNDATAGASAAAAMQAAMGPRLSDADTATLQTAMNDASHAFGTWTRVSLASDLSGVRLDTPATDPAAAMKATREMVELAQIPAFRAPLEAEAHVKLASVADGSAHFDAVAAPVDKRTNATKPKPATPALPATATWIAQAGALAFAAGHGSQNLLTAPPTVLANDAQASHALGRLGSNGSFALVLQPAAAMAMFGRVTSPPSSPHAAIILGWGRAGADAWVTASLDAPLVHDLSRLLIGL